MTPVQIARLRSLALKPVDVRTLPPTVLHALASHHSIEISKGMASISGIGRRQLRNSR
jgi:hypothetical protein